MAKRYWLKHGGRKIYHETKAAVTKAARQLADTLGVGVPIGFDDLTGSKRVASAHRTTPFMRNPVMQGHDFTGEEYKVTAYKGRTPIVAYADSKAEADDLKRQFKAQGYSFTLGRQTRKAMTSNPVKAARTQGTSGLAVYNAGKQAGREGYPKSDCPYSNSHTREVWRKGWTAGRA